MTITEIAQCQSEWEQTEMADLSSGHLDSERKKLYHKWFAKMLDHIHDRNNQPWTVGMRADWERELRAILDGIDKTSSSYDEGWFETSKGAEFGRDVQERLIVFIKTLLTPSTSR